MALSAIHQHDFTIIQISDTHLMDQEHLAFAQSNPAETLKAVLTDIKQRYPHADAIFHTGDLAQVAVDCTYQYYLNLMHSLAIAHYQIPGNHDDLTLFPFHQGSDQVHAIHLGQWTIILLNSAVDNEIYGCISSTQLQQLESLLKQYSQQHIILTCHHHPFEIQSKWIDQHMLKNADHFTAMLTRHMHIKAVLFGHVHQESWQNWNDIQFYSTPSTCIQFKPNSDIFALDQAAPGYRVLHLSKNGHFKTEIHRIENAIISINPNISGY